MILMIVMITMLKLSVMTPLIDNHTRYDTIDPELCYNMYA